VYDVEATPGTVLLAGAAWPFDDAPSRGFIARRAGDGWAEEPIAAGELWNWSLHQVQTAAAAGWALGLEERGPSFQRVLLQRGAEWQVVRPYGWRGGDFWIVARFCTDPSGTSWFVGTQYDAQHRAHALAVRQRDGTFEPVPIGQLAGPGTAVDHVACLGGGGAVAVGAAGMSEDRRDANARAILLHYDGAWRGEWFPDHLRGVSVTALAALSATDVWLAVTSPDGSRTMFLHRTAAGWEEVVPPALPDGRSGGYVVRDMQFVSVGEGWAVANDTGGPGLVRGLIFHYRDGAWRLRNWNWHFWHQPYFGLLGD
jgi:hypothetical protein